MNEREQLKRLTDFFEAFTDERTCKDYLFTLRFLNGFICPKCGCKSYGRIRDRLEFQCHDCGQRTSLMSGLMVHRTHLLLCKWFLAIFLITHDKRGYSAMQLAHELKVTRKSVGNLLQCIRAVMELQVKQNVMGGTVELDGTYIGSKGKTPGRSTEKNLCRNSHICTNGFRLIAAGLASYSGLDVLGFDGDDVNRSPLIVHRIISNFKSVIKGTCHGVRKDHLQSYMDEFVYCYGNRKKATVFHTLLCDICFAIKRANPVQIELFRFQSMSDQKVAA